MTEPGIKAKAIAKRKATIEPMPAFYPVLLAFVRGSP